MARLTAAQRSKMSKSDFGLPGGTKASGGKPAYPMKDKAHAGNAKARASQAVNAGRMSTSTEKKIDAKADKVLGKPKPRSAAATARTRGATARRASAPSTSAKPADHLAMAAQHRAMADAHRDAADRHVAKAVDAAAKSIGGMKPDSKDGMTMAVNYGGMSTPGLGEAVRARTRTRK